VLFFPDIQFTFSFFTCSFNIHQENIHVIAIVTQQLSYLQEFSTSQYKHVFKKNKYAILTQCLSIWLFLYFIKLPLEKKLAYCSFSHTLLVFNHHATCIFLGKFIHVSCLFLSTLTLLGLGNPSTTKHSLRKSILPRFSHARRAPTYFQASTTNL
jgi:hypothetical protein